MKRILPILLIITLVASVYAILPFGEAAAEPSIPGGYEMVGRSQNLVLYCNEEARAIAIEDRRNGYTWKSLVDKEVYPDYDSANMMWKNYMQSIIVLNYINLTVKDISNFKAYSSVDATSVKMNRINNGVSMEFNFDTIGISVYTEFFLEGDNLVIRIPADKIREEKDMGLISIELLPFLGAASRYVDGYVFYPDGCGALTRYSNVDQRLQNVRPFTWSIYSSQQVNLREYNDMKRSGKDWAMLPVLGIKNNDNAMLAAVVTGMENCNINVHPEGYAVNLNRIYFEFVYRHFFNTYLSNITVNGRGISKNPVRIKADKEITRLDREVRLFFLHGEQANYSGMAAVYRDYLKKNDLINAAINKGQDIPLGIDFFMGITEERILFDKFIPMTTFKDAQFIINELLGKGINNISVMLKGWTKKGYGLYPTRWPPDNRLGGSKGLMEFTDYIKKNHLELFLQVNFTEGDQKFGGFSTKNDVVFQGNNLPVTGTGNDYFLINPAKVKEKVKEFLKEADSYNGGLAFENIGRFIYHDYNKKNPSTREQTAKEWQELLIETKNKGLSTAVGGGNLYVLKYADRLYDIPMTSSNYFITDENVPFYQMVVHGSIPYSSDPGNLSYDLRYHVLKWVEYGCMPYFELTFQKSINLKNTEYSRLFTSYYSQWNDVIADVYNELNSRLKDVWSESITLHEKLDKDLYKVEYSNGAIVYINYGMQQAQADGFIVKPQDFLVVNKGGVTR